ncbi:MAG: hypothetical protein AAFR81_24015, partial [Chloroflexota bacterium]
EQIALLNPTDVDTLTEILDKWNVHDAQIILEELERVVDADSDELHVIQPLIEKGLWIFGPEYESVSYTSNKGLTQVIRGLMNVPDAQIEKPRRRPDFVVLPDTRIGVFSCDSYGTNAEVDGIAKVLLLELKRGGFEITKKEIRQAEDYASEISNKGDLVPTGQIVCYVLGSKLNNNAKPRTIGDEADIQIKVIPRTYRTIIQQAKARTFHLKDKIEKRHQNESDEVVQDILLIKPRNQKSE